MKFLDIEKDPIDYANKALKTHSKKWVLAKEIARIPVNLALALADLASEWAGGKQ